MITFQDFEKARTDNKLADFVLQAISEYAATDDYQNAILGREYMRQCNRTIVNTRKWLRDAFGQRVPDLYSPNYRAASAFYKANNIQIAQHLLSNGATFQNEGTKDRLGGAEFDNKLVRCVRAALSEGRAYGFFDGEKVTILYADQLVPLLDENTGAIRAAIRHWRLDSGKPLNITLYEENGYIEMRQEKSEPLKCLPGFSWTEPKPYRSIVARDRTGAAEVIGYENFPGLPIVPCYSNYDRVAEIVGKRENIDLYDLIKSGLANNIEEASFIWWEMSNASGMDDVDIARFKQRLTEMHVAKTSGQTQLTAHQLEVPTQAREALLNRLENDIYSDAMTVNMDRIAGGEVRAASIRAAYMRLNARVDELEYCVIEFIKGLLDLIGVEDVPSFTRSPVVNDDEVTQMVLSAAEYLDEETLLNKLPFLSADEVEQVLERRAAESVARFNAPETEGEGVE